MAHHLLKYFPTRCLCLFKEYKNIQSIISSLLTSLDLSTPILKYKTMKNKAKRLFSSHVTLSPNFTPNDSNDLNVKPVISPETNGLFHPTCHSSSIFTSTSRDLPRLNGFAKWCWLSGTVSRWYLNNEHNH